MVDAEHDALLAELDAVLREAPPELEQDLGAELSALMSEYRDSRETERPGSKEGT